jgi:CBS domain-containing protein
MLTGPSSSDYFFTKRVADLHFRQLSSCHKGLPVHQAAALMAEQKISCLFIHDDSGEIAGSVTDITLRDEVLAVNLPLTIAVGQVMDPNLIFIDSEAFLYEALLMMFKTKTRYLLVKDKGKYIGWISRTKILTLQSQSPFIFIQSVKQAVDGKELRAKWEQVPGMVYELITRGLKAQLINQIISAIADAIALRIIENTIKEIGPPPARFVFFVMGSEGREEQTLKTDQDNAIIYEDKANEQRDLVRAYFLDFADRVSTALDQVGFTFCKGGFMAKNPKWTHSLSHWKRNYEEWILDSTQETVMTYATFFDCRAIYGDFRLLEELQNYMEEQLEQPPEKFYINMGANALQFEPPLTFFKNIRTFKIDGEKHFNIKKTMTPIVDLIRVFALKHRIFETNTGKRLQELTSLGVFSPKEEQELSHAYYYLMALRLEIQALELIHNQQRPHNYIRLDQLTKVQVAALIEIFKVIKEFQLKIKIEFTKNIF